MPPLKDIVQQPWFHFSGFAVGLIGIIITVVALYFSRKVKRLGYSRRSFNLVRKNRSSLSSLEVRFNGRQVQALTITKVLIWNTGTEAIRSSDLAPKEKLRLSMSGSAELLESEIIQSNSESCNWRLGELEEKEQVIEFDFLDPADGIVLQVAHTGISSRALNLNGQIVGKGKITEKQRGGLSSFVLGFGRSRINYDVARKGRWFIGTVVLIVGVSTALIPFTSVYIDANESSEFFKWVLGLAGLFYVFTAISLFRSGPPKGLEKYQDSFSKEDEKKQSL